MIRKYIIKIRSKIRQLINHSSRVQKYMEEFLERRPLDINIETITACPLSCKFCCNKNYNRSRIVMPLDHFENLIEQYCDMGGGTIAIGSMQSDFLSDPLLMERISVLEKYKDHLWIYSTTPLISAKKLSDEQLLRILKVFSLIEISVAGHDRKSYFDMVGLDAFEVLHSELKRIARLIKENDLNICVWIDYRTNNADKLKESDLYKELEEIFDKSSILDSFFSWFGTIKQSDLPKGATVITQYNYDKKEDCLAACTLAINADGTVVGCGCIDWLGKYVIGDTYKDSLKDIWQSKIANDFRHCFSNGLGNLPSICQECALYSPYDFYNRKYKDYNSMQGVRYFI